MYTASSESMETTPSPSCLASTISLQLPVHGNLPRMKEPAVYTAKGNPEASGALAPLRSHKEGLQVMPLSRRHLTTFSLTPFAYIFVDGLPILLN